MFLFSMLFVSSAVIAQTNGAITPAPAEPTTSQSQTTPVVMKESWTDKVKLGGDFRFRTDRQQPQGGTDRIRNRLRTRVSAQGQVNDEVSVTVRLATGNVGSENAISTNQTFENGADKKIMWLDLAYADWKKDQCSVQIGKVPTVFSAAGKNTLVWDPDLTLEGAQYKHTFGSNLYAALGGYWLDENNSATVTKDPMLAGAQVGGTAKLSGIDAGLSVGYYSFDVKDSTTWFTVPATSMRGNSSPGAGVFTYDYNVLDVGLELGFNAAQLPLLVYGNYIQNTAISRENKGWLAGLRIGKLKDRGSWSFDYNYRETKADATLATFNDSDFGTGGTDNRGHIAQAQYQLGKGVSTSVTYFRAETTVATAAKDSDRAMLDFLFGF